METATEIVKVESTTLPIIESSEVSTDLSDMTLPVTKDFVVVAKNSEEMARAQASLVRWATAKIEFEKQELVSAETQLKQIKLMKQRSGAYNKLVQLAKDRVLYYEKIKTALELGYCIVPNFPVEIIAVRVDHDAEPGYFEIERWQGTPEVTPDKLPVGEGRYIHPIPKTAMKKKTVKDAEGKDKTKSVRFPLAYRSVEFPAALAKIEILNSLDRAQQAKVFDALGILPATRRPSPDPMLIGQIQQNPGGAGNRTTSFMIAWWVDTASL